MNKLRLKQLQNGTKKSQVPTTNGPQNQFVLQDKYLGLVFSNFAVNSLLVSADDVDTITVKQNVTAGRTLNIKQPDDKDQRWIKTIVNSGTLDFTTETEKIRPGKAVSYVWDRTQWIPTGSAGQKGILASFEYTGTASQTVFILPSVITSANYQCYINGVGVSPSAFVFSGNTVTYIPGNNGGYVIQAGDRVQIDGIVDGINNQSTFTVAIANTLTFTLPTIPPGGQYVSVHINGIRIGNTAYSTAGNILTYIPVNNGGYTTQIGDLLIITY